MKSFGAVYQEHWDLVYNFLYRMCRNESLAEELTQETFFQAMQSWERFRGDSSVATWLCGIAKRLYYTSLRKATDLPLEDVPKDTAPDIAETLLAGDRQMTVQHILHQLPEPYREIFTLRTFCDLSHGKIGELFHKSDNWARVTYYRARMMLIQAIEEAEKE